MDTQAQTPPQTRTDALQAAQQPCVQCRAMFTPKRRWARFCSPACRSAFNRSPSALAEKIAELEKRVAALERARI